MSSPDEDFDPKVKKIAEALHELLGSQYGTSQDGSDLYLCQYAVKILLDQDIIGPGRELVRQQLADDAEKIKNKLVEFIEVTWQEAKKTMTIKSDHSEHSKGKE